MITKSYQQAREVFEKFVPDGKERRQIADVYADLILHANEISPSSWEITVAEDRIMFNVGPVETLILRKGRLSCNFRNASHSAPADAVDPKYASMKGKRQFKFGTEDLSDFLKRYRALKRGIFAWIDDAAKSKSKWWYAHSQAFVEYIAELSGQRLPSPAYYPWKIRNFIQYHDSDRMGSAPTDLTQGEDFGISTNKSPQMAINSRIWLVAGEGTPRRYYLCYSFIADMVKKSSGRSGFKYVIDGNEGLKFNPPILLDEFPWFQRFLKTRFYSLGLSQVPAKVVAELELLADSKGTLPGEPELDSAATLEEFFERTRAISPARRKALVERWVRNNPPEVRKLKRMTRGICQFPGCEARILKKDGTPYSEVAHIEAFADGGETALGNLIVLCPNHHKEFDLGERVIDEQTSTYLKGRLNGKPFEIPIINAKSNN